MPLPLTTKLAAVLPAPVKQLLIKARRQFWRLFPPRHLFVFGGRIAYWPGFGQDLYAREPVFRATVQECERALLALGGKPLLAHFEGSADPRFLADEGRVVQFVTVIQLALVELWRAYGVEPEAVMGISNGEPAAIYAAGGLTLVDAIRVSMSWALISQVESPVYGTLLLNSDYAHAKALCDGCPVGLFVVTDVVQTRQTLFCALADMEASKAYLRAQGASYHQIKTEPIWPYHTPVLIQHEAVLRGPLEGVQPRPTTKPCYLTTLGGLLPVGSLLPWDYWLRPPQEPAFQRSTIEAAVNDRYLVMIPVSTYPFSYAGRQAQKQAFGRIRFTAPFTGDKPELATFEMIREQLLNIGLAPG